MLKNMANKPDIWKLTFITHELAAAEAALEAFGATTYSTERPEDLIDDPWLFSIYFDGKPQLDGLVLPDDAVPQLQCLPDTDWVSESQQNLPPVAIAPFYLHGSHDAPLNGGWHNIEMQAGLAFGSGHHGTTQGCLVLFAELLKRHPRPLHIADIGCGSGVLAIAAAKAGCKEVLASDMDPDAVAVTSDNAALNQVAPHIRVFEAAGVNHPAYIGRRFDVIFANIMATPLIKLATDFEAHLAPTGRLILSGLLNEQARSVKARYRTCGLKVEHQHRIGEWTSLCLMR